MCSSKAAGGKNRDVVGAGCVKDNVGKIVVQVVGGLERAYRYLMRSSAKSNRCPVIGPGEKIFGRG